MPALCHSKSQQAYKHNFAKGYLPFHFTVYSDEIVKTVRDVSDFQEKCIKLQPLTHTVLCDGNHFEFIFCDRDFKDHEDKDPF